MRQLLTTTLTLLALLAGTPVWAVTAGPICRAACAPRIAQDCGAPGVLGFGKCKRRLVRACKRTTPQVACAVGADGGLDGGGTGGGGTGVGGSNGGLAAQVTAALANKRFEAGSDQFFSSGSITEVDDMTLCQSGQMHLVVTTITSTSTPDFSNTFDSTETFDGNWSVTVESGSAILELATGEPAARRFTVELGASGAIIIDGRTATLNDASGECGTGGNGGTPGGGTPGDDVVQQITQALADQVLVIEEDNIGFGHRVTAMVLCASARYALEIDASVVPGVEVSTQGAWTVQVDGATATLALAGEGSQPTRTFTLTSDAQGNILLNGIAPRSGSRSIVGQVCPTL